MNKVINNRLYDTDTATIIANHCNYHLCSNDICSKETTLFRKDNGEFFLHTYCSSIDEGSCSGTAIIPLSYDEAKEYAAEMLSGTEYMKIFGIVEE